MKASFTALSDLHGEYVCWACEWALATRWTRSAFVCIDGGVTRLKRKDFWPSLFAPPSTPFVLYLTTSGQKHGLYKARVNRTRGQCHVQCEDWSCEVTEGDREWMICAVKARMLGVGRSALESCEFTSRDVLSAGKEFRWVEATMRKAKGRPTFRLMELMPGVADLPQCLTPSASL